MARAAVYCLGVTTVAFAFRTAELANLNKGITVSLFTSNVVFTTIIFKILYGEKTSAARAAGICLIILSVYFVGRTDSEGPLKQEFLLSSIFWAVTSGLVFSLTGLISKHYVSKHDFTPMKLTIDGLILAAIIMLCGYFFTDIDFTFRDWIYGVLVGVLLIAGSVCIAYAMKSGKGGPITAIDTLKSVIPVAINCAAYSIWPTGWQWLGLVAGICGAVTIGVF